MENNFLAKIVIVGLDQAGKTSIVKALQEGEFVNTNRTVGYNAESLEIAKLKINVLDLGGQKAFRSTWTMHLNNLNCLIWVIDSSTPDRFNEAVTEFDLIKDLIPSQAIIIVLANKQDSEDAESIETIKRVMKLQFLMFKWKIFPTSTITNEGLRDAFTWMYENLTQEKLSQPNQFTYNIPIEHLENNIFKCLYLEAGECPTPKLVPKSCPTCIYGSCRNCLAQTPDCLLLFPEYIKTDDIIK
ncbi:MAG: ADP-ribosylation factor family protein [Candidatus Thorarchaeota archaeon]